MTSPSRPVDGFRLAYDDEGDGPPVVLLHGWPGDRHDYREMIPLLRDHARVVVPDLRGFGGSDKHDVDPAEHYSAAAQARSVGGLIDELGLGPVVLGGYDIGSRTAQALARSRPELVRSMVLAPPMPGVGRRVLEPDAQREFWYQPFHQLGLAEELIDGNRGAARRYLAHFWRHWSGPDYEADPAELDRLANSYAAPGAFRASICWYRAGAGTVALALAPTTPPPDERLSVPLTVLWPEYDPLFPRAWSDAVERFYPNAEIREVDGVGHFAPLEYPKIMADAIIAAG